MVPLKCLTSCEVPYLCAIACPLNERLDEFASQPGRHDDVPVDATEPFQIVIAEEKESSQNDQAKS